MQVLVTGATGFVGSAVVRRLAGDLDFAPIAAVRRSSATLGARVRIVADLGPATDWVDSLAGVEAVVHCAARAHQLNDRSSDTAQVFRSVNAEGTCRLAQQAAYQGVRRFVFISSIKVNGELTAPGRAFTEADAPSPQDSYGASKLEAELALYEIAGTTGMEVVIIRPPLVYGPQPKGNLVRLIDLICRGVPLPLASVRNSRSLVALDNLTSAIALTLTHPTAAGKVYLISDQKDLSTPDLVRVLAKGMGRPARLWPAPVGLLRVGGAVTGLAGEVDRLVDSLVVDSELISRELGWKPVRAPQDALEEMSRSFVR